MTKLQLLRRGLSDEAGATAEEFRKPVVALGNEILKSKATAERFFRFFSHHGEKNSAMGRNPSLYCGAI
jgi:hypothetical protein